MAADNAVSNVGKLWDACRRLVWDASNALARNLGSVGYKAW